MRKRSPSHVRHTPDRSQKFVAQGKLLDVLCLESELPNTPDGHSGILNQHNLHPHGSLLTLTNCRPQLMRLGREGERQSTHLLLPTSSLVEEATM